MPVFSFTNFYKGVIIERLMEKFAAVAAAAAETAASIDVDGNDNEDKDDGGIKLSDDRSADMPFCIIFI